MASMWEVKEVVTDKRVVVWFSCGAASAVAARIAVKKYPNCKIVYCDTLEFEHPDNRRFLMDVSEWIGKDIEIIKSDRYKDIYDVFYKTRFLKSGKGGAACTKYLKQNVRKAYQEEGDIHIFGMHIGEQRRISKFVNNNPELEFDWLLIDMRITKEECLRWISRAGIEIPTMYKLGYRNNNCIGCVKGGAGYWNKIRVDFPYAFERMAKAERDLGAALCRVSNKEGGDDYVYLDELDPTQGHDLPLPDIECGALCVSSEEDKQKAEEQFWARYGKKRVRGVT